VDLEFACKAATAGMQAVAGMLEARAIDIGLTIGADTAQSKPHDILEYTSAAAGAAYLLGREKLIARLVSYTSYSSDTPDFWRRDGIQYPSHAGRFTGEPAYFAHVVGAALRLFAKAQCKPSDFDYCVFHMPNGKFPREVARRLGFTADQLAPSLIVSDIGNPYTASTLIGLAAVLDIAKPGEKIFTVSYGSGAGSDAFIWETTAALPQIQKSKLKTQNLVRQQIERKTYVDYVQYLKQTHKI
jgi:hydroxymethylglutaryl-CoA synthase